jgi:hypothetical protein
VLFDAIQSAVAPALKLLPDKATTANAFSGNAWLDGKITVDSNGAVSMNGSFVAAGPWTLPHS